MDLPVRADGTAVGSERSSRHSSASSARKPSFQRADAESTLRSSRAAFSDSSGSPVRGERRGTPAPRGVRSSVSSRSGLPASVWGYNGSVPGPNAAGPQGRNGRRPLLEFLPSDGTPGLRLNPWTSSHPTPDARPRGSAGRNRLPGDFGKLRGRPPPPPRRGMQPPAILREWTPRTEWYRPMRGLGFRGAERRQGLAGFSWRRSFDSATRNDPDPGHRRCRAGRRSPLMLADREFRRGA
jgi:hypothetical protein